MNLLANKMLLNFFIVGEMNRLKTVVQDKKIERSARIFNDDCMKNCKNCIKIISVSFMVFYFNVKLSSFKTL